MSDPIQLNLDEELIAKTIEEDEPQEEDKSDN